MPGQQGRERSKRMPHAVFNGSESGESKGPKKDSYPIQPPNPIHQAKAYKNLYINKKK